MPNSVRRLVLLLGILAVLATAHAAKIGELAAVDPPRPAPGFSLPDLTGEVHELGDYRGQLLLVNFWATWCRPCREEMPALERLDHRLKQDGIAVVAINMGDERVHVARFDAEQKLSFPLLLDPTGDVARKQWKVPGLPMTYIIDPGGRIIYTLAGAYEWDSPEMTNRLKELAERLGARPESNDDTAPDG